MNDITPIQNKYVGIRVFVIGNGPSDLPPPVVPMFKLGYGKTIKEKINENYKFIVHSLDILIYGNGCRKGLKVV